jgi:ubiquinone/menaquinone biosynthesis C-methylase UbiE
MKSTAPSTFVFVDEGEAFAALEGQSRDHRTHRRKDEPMTHNTEQTNPEEHFAPAEAWDAIAAGYDRHVAPAEAELAGAALELARLRSGDRFLDVAAGPGGLSLPAARLGAKVVATDWSPKMIERFVARVRNERIPDAEGKVMDCHALDFAANTFDVTGSAFGVMLVPDQAKALREMVRVTKPGGRMVIVAYGSPSRFEALQVFLGALKSVNPGFEGLPASPPPLEFQVADPGVLRERLAAAGLRDVFVDTTHEERIAIRSGRELWDWCVGSNPIPGMLVSELSENQRKAMLARLEESIRGRASASGVAVLTAPLNIGVGTK